jgi:LptA/(LptD N-terminal domain) LPS transport protein
LCFAYKRLHSYSILIPKFLNVASQFRPKFSPFALSPSALSPIARALMPLLVGAYAASGGGGDLIIHVSAQQSITPTQAELDSAIRESLKPDRSIPTPGGLKQRKKEGPKVLEADSIDGVNEKNVTAKGNVVLQQDNMTVTADRVEYDQTTDTANVPGRMRMKRDSDVITGSDLKIKIFARQIPSAAKPTLRSSWGRSKNGYGRPGSRAPF